jgi:two-component system OmpR family sensor kinase
MMLLFCLVVATLLISSSLIFYTLLAREVHAQLDRQLVETERPVAADLASDPTENDVDQLNLHGNFFELLDLPGRILQQSQNLQDRPLRIPGEIPGSHAAFRTLHSARFGTLRLALVPFQRSRQTQVLALAIPTRSAENALRSFRHIIEWVLPISLLLTAFIARWYVRRSLEPVGQLTEHARQMAERISNSAQGDLWTPLAVANSHDELGRLAETFNQLFRRVDAAVRQLRQFVTDASHELRTPLSVLQGETELVLAKPRQAEDYHNTLTLVGDELKKLNRIVEGLFTLSMADARQLRLNCGPVYLNEVLEEACALAMPRARAKDIEIERHLVEGVAYRGDEAFLRELFLIFLDNSIKYSPPHTRVRVQLAQTDSIIRIVFQDEGAGIAPEHLPRIFERFFRAAPDGGGDTQSGGLGLAIAQAIAQAHGGSIECSSELGKGSIFTVALRPEGKIKDKR